MVYGLNWRHNFVAVWQFLIKSMLVCFNNISKLELPPDRKRRPAITPWYYSSPYAAILKFISAVIELIQSDQAEEM